MTTHSADVAIKDKRARHAFHWRGMARDDEHAAEEACDAMRRVWAYACDERGHAKRTLPEGTAPERAENVSALQDGVETLCVVKWPFRNAFTGMFEKDDDQRRIEELKSAGYRMARACAWRYHPLLMGETRLPYDIKTSFALNQIGYADMDSLEIRYQIRDEPHGRPRRLPMPAEAIEAMLEIAARIWAHLPTGRRVNASGGFILAPESMTLGAAQMAKVNHGVAEAEADMQSALRGVGLERAADAVAAANLRWPEEAA